MPLPKIIRSRRKTIALIIQADGSLLVRAPQRATNRQIAELVEQKAEWIRARQAQAIARPKVEAHQFASGEQFWYLGHAYPLVASVGTQNGLEFSGGQFKLALLLPSSRRPTGGPTRWEEWLLEGKRPGFIHRLVPPAGAPVAGRTRGRAGAALRLQLSPGENHLGAHTVGLLLNPRHAQLPLAAGDGAPGGDRLRGGARADAHGGQWAWAGLLEPCSRRSCQSTSSTSAG